MMLPTRKRTRLLFRNYSQPGFYFITICTKQKRCILSEIVGDGALDVPQIQLTPIGGIIKKYIESTDNIPNITIQKYVIMPNHLHMIVHIQPVKDEKDGADINGTSRAPSPTNDMLPHMVSTLKRFCNAEIGENIFQRSYHDHIIRNSDDYANISNYITLNPSRWKQDCFYSIK